MKNKTYLSILFASIALLTSCTDYSRSDRESLSEKPISDNEYIIREKLFDQHHIHFGWKVRLIDGKDTARFFLYEGGTGAVVVKY